MPTPLPAEDKKLVQIVDAALLDAEWRSGEWLVCKPGCTPCCIGVFAIDQLDVARLQAGMAELDANDPDRAERIRRRSQESWERLAGEFPGNSLTGVLGDDDEAASEFEDYADYEPCPALNPQNGTCEVYAWRPITCRVFGPPVRSEGGLGVCEICYHGASAEEIATCELKLDEANELQVQLVAEVEKSGKSGRTIVAFALAQHVAVSK